MKRCSLRALLFLAALLLLPTVPHAAPTCSYNSYRWNVRERRAVAPSRIVHPYSELVAEEIDPLTGCTVCEEDQVWLSVASLPPLRFCRKLAPQVEEVLQRLHADGVPLLSATGYRVGRTRGAVDGDGNRTGFSNHSYGVALDLNAELNGLYEQCPVFGPGCRLLRGGPWQPQAPGGLSAQGVTVQELRGIGLRWGGEIAGRQKDFMHFSPSGY